MVKKKKINNKIFNKTNKYIKNHCDVLTINNSIVKVKECISDNFDDLSAIEIQALNIKEKMVSAPRNIRMEDFIEALPANNLRELAGDFSKKLRYKDLSDLYKMNKKSLKIIEQHEILQSKERVLNIELLQKKIEILLNGQG